MVEVPADEYEQLKKDAFMLRCLNNAGVDNWDGEWYARQEYNKRYRDECDEDMDDPDLD